MPETYIPPNTCAIHIIIQFFKYIPNIVNTTDITEKILEAMILNLLPLLSLCGIIVIILIIVPINMDDCTSVRLY